MTLPSLILPLKREYFDAIKRGEKVEEYRLDTPYWRKRLYMRHYGRIVLTLGYPKADDHERRIIKPWRGYVERTILHPHFGPEPVRVFAIHVGAQPMGLEICEERCNQCLFSENRIVSETRMAQIVRDCRRNDTHFQCHKHTIEGRDVMCRGYYETQPPSQMLRIAERLHMVRFVSLPKEGL